MKELVINTKFVKNIAVGIFLVMVFLGFATSFIVFWGLGVNIYTIAYAIFVYLYWGYSTNFVVKDQWKINRMIIPVIPVRFE